MPVARFVRQRRVRRGVMVARFKNQRRNWRGTTKQSVTPTITSISPNTAIMGAANLTCTLTGTGYISGVTRIFLNNDEVAATFVSATAITCVIPAAMMAAAGTISVSCANGLLNAPTPRTFTVTAT